MLLFVGDECPQPGCSNLFSHGCSFVDRCKCCIFLIRPTESGHVLLQVCKFEVMLTMERPIFVHMSGLPHPFPSKDDNAGVWLPFRVLQLLGLPTQRVDEPVFVPTTPDVHLMKEMSCHRPSGFLVRPPGVQGILFLKTKTGEGVEETIHRDIAGIEYAAGDGQSVNALGPYLDGIDVSLFWPGLGFWGSGVPGRSSPSSHGRDGVLLVGVLYLLHFVSVPNSFMKKPMLSQCPTNCARSCCPIPMKFMSVGQMHLNMTFPELLSKIRCLLRALVMMSDKSFKLKNWDTLASSITSSMVFAKVRLSQILYLQL